RFGLWDWLVVVLPGLGLSLLVEFLQNFTYNRISTMSDTFNNFLGTAIGAVVIDRIYLQFGNHVKRFLETLFSRKPEMIMAAMLLCLIGLVTLAPYNFEVSVEKLVDRLQAFLGNPFATGPEFPAEAMLTVLLYAAFSYYFIRGVWLYFPGGRRPGILIGVVAFCALTALALELSQFTLRDRRRSLLDPLLAWWGIAVGAAIALAQMKRLASRPELSRSLWHRMEYLIRTNQQFLNGLGVTYFLFFAAFAFLPLGIQWDTTRLGTKWEFFYHPYQWMFVAKENRLVIVLDWLEIGLLFFAQGFFVANWINRYGAGENPRSRVWGITGLMLTLAIGARFFIFTQAPHWTQLLAGGVGIWWGIVFEEFFDFIFTRHPYDETIPVRPPVG
ncbi:MAG: hypothetical protein D6681_16915, partial [Calditrichaeota bacterium]